MIDLDELKKLCAEIKQLPFYGIGKNLSKRETVSLSTGAKAIEALPGLVEEVEKLRSALEFYGDEKNYFGRIGKAQPSKIWDDKGQRAREALDVKG